MKCKWLLMSILSTLAIAVVTVDPAFARDKHKISRAALPTSRTNFHGAFCFQDTPHLNPTAVRHRYILTANT